MENINIMDNSNSENIRNSINNIKDELRTISKKLNGVEKIILHNYENECDLNKETIINSMNFYIWNEFEDPPIKRRRLNNE
jgi:hypothetical protein